MHTVKRGRKYKCRVCQEELLLDVLESVIGVMQIEGCSKRQLAEADRADTEVCPTGDGREA